MNETAPTPSHPLLAPLFRALRLIGLILLVLFILVTALLPVWISGPQGRIFLLQQFNDRLQGGSLQVQDWSIGWFRGLSFRGLELRASDGQTILSCPSGQSDLTLSSLLRRQFDLGNARLESPRLALRLFPDTSTDLARLRWNAAPLASRQRVLWLAQRLRGLLQIQQGECQGIAPGLAPWRLTGCELRLEIASYQALVHLQCQALDGAGRNALKCQATFPPIAAWSDDPLGILQELEFQSWELPTAPLALWLGLDPLWKEALGNQVDLSASYHPETQDLARLGLNLRGTQGFCQLRGQVTRDASGRTLSCPSGRDSCATASLRIAPPVARLLGYLNPTLLAAVSGRLEAELLGGQVPLNPAAGLDLAGLQGTAQIRLPGLILANQGLLGQLLARSHWKSITPKIKIDLPPTRIQLGENQVTTTPLILRLDQKTALEFRGSVAWNRQLHLRVSLPADPKAYVGSSTEELPIEGTLDAPTLPGEF